MEAALRNCLAVSRFRARSFLLFFAQDCDLRALLVTPKAHFELSPCELCPRAHAKAIGLGRLLQSCRTEVSVEQRTFSLYGGLRGGGGCVGKQAAVERLEPKKASRWLDVLSRISESPVAPAPELEQLDTGLQHPSFDTFLEVVDAMAQANWLNAGNKVAVVEALLRAAEHMYLESQTKGMEVDQQLAATAQISVSQMRRCIVRDEMDEVYTECCFDTILSALQETASGVKATEMRAVQGALEGTSTAEIQCDAAVFRESLVAAHILQRVVSTQTHLMGVLDEFLKNPQEWAWQVLAMLAKTITKLPAQDLVFHLETRLQPLALLRAGPNSWRVRLVAVECLESILRSNAPTQAKELAGSVTLRALDCETHEVVRERLKQLPRSYLGSGIICGVLSGAGACGYYNTKTDELRRLQHPLFHGTARVVATLKGTLIVTGGLLNPRKSFEVDPETMEARELGTLGSPRFWHGSCLVGFEVIVCGGRPSPEAKAINLCEKLTGDKWVKVANMTRRRESLTCAAYNLLVFAVGGLGDDGAAQSIEVLDKGEWRRLSLVLASAVLIPGVVVKSEQELVICGGRGESLLADTVTVNLETGTKQRMPLLPHACAFAGDMLALRSDALVCLNSECAELLTLPLGAKQWAIRSY